MTSTFITYILGRTDRRRTMKASSSSVRRRRWFFYSVNTGVPRSIFVFFFFFLLPVDLVIESIGTGASRWADHHRWLECEYPRSPFSVGIEDVGTCVRLDAERVHRGHRQAVSESCQSTCQFVLYAQRQSQKKNKKNRKIGKKYIYIFINRPAFLCV